MISSICSTRPPETARFWLGISAEQLAYVTNSEPGHGLLFFNNVILPFADDFPKDTELYRLLTTKPSEVEHAAETEE